MKVKKETQYNFRMTEEEKKLLRQKAEQSGRTVSEYIRAKLFGGERATINAVEFLAQYKIQLFEMKKIGNNINQLAHYANTCNKQGVLSEKIVQEMNQRFGELIECERALEELHRKINR